MPICREILRKSHFFVILKKNLRKKNGKNFKIFEFSKLVLNVVKYANSWRNMKKSGFFSF